MKRTFTKYPQNYVKASTSGSMTYQDAIGTMMYIRTLLSDNEDIDEINEALVLAVKALKKMAELGETK